jgi:hypothetical protein
MHAAVPYEVAYLSRGGRDREFHGDQLVRALQELEKSGLETRQISGSGVTLALSDDERVELFV